MNFRTLGGPTRKSLILGAILSIGLSGCFDKDDPNIEPEVKEDGNLEYKDPDGNVIGELPPLPFEPAPEEPKDPQEPEEPTPEPPWNPVDPETPTDPGTPTDPETPTDPTQPSAGEPAVLIGAGDIARCNKDKADYKTSDIILKEIAKNPNTMVFTAGDNAYSDGSASEFKECYDPSWGRFKDRTRPTAGNHEYGTSGASGHFNYFGEAAGKKGEGWYSYDLGSWHIVAINSNCSAVGGCGPGSKQYEWLKQDLAKSGKKCIAAYWHHPRFTSGAHGDVEKMGDIWKLLNDNGGDVILQGHDHHYERFAKMDSKGNITDTGMRSFVVGSGGTSFRDVGERKGSEIQQNTVHGVMKLTLHADKYEWEFLPVEGKSFVDKGEDSCL